MRRSLIVICLSFFCTLASAQSSKKELQAKLHSAHSMYLHGTFQSRQQAMLSLIELLESVDTQTRNNAVGPNILAVSYIRLGLLAKENKDLELAGQYFNQGLTTYKQHDTSMTMEELVESTYNLDSIARQYTN